MSTEFLPNEKILAEKIDYSVELLRTGKIILMSDLDGTRIRSSVPATIKFNTLNHTNYTERDLNRAWAMVKWAEDLHIPNPREYAINLWNSYDVLRYSEPVQGSAELARFLYFHRGSKIIVPGITARPAYALKATLDWHTQWMPWSDDRKNFFIHETDAVSSDFKAKTVKGQGVTYYLEDQTADAETIADVSPDTTVILVSQPWNEQYIVPEKYSGRILKAERGYGTSKVVSAFYAMVEHIAE